MPVMRYAVSNCTPENVQRPAFRFPGRLPVTQNEQWTIVEVPASFQQIVDRLLSR